MISYKFSRTTSSPNAHTAVSDEVLVNEDGTTTVMELSSLSGPLIEVVEDVKLLFVTGRTKTGIRIPMELFIQRTFPRMETEVTVGPIIDDQQELEIIFLGKTKRISKQMETALSLLQESLEYVPDDLAIDINHLLRQFDAN